MKNICIIIPCYNEAERFDIGHFDAFYLKSEYSFIFVNDGSTDNTLELLLDISKDRNRVKVVNLVKNGGKAEAVRQGFLEGYKFESFDYIGFWDADFATPLNEVLFFEKFFNGEKQIIFGARVKRMGAQIIRKASRHYFGRIFSTITTKLFKLPIYDTQCGAKFFHVSLIPLLFEKPFFSKWMFDIEIFVRYKKIFGEKVFLESCYEYPLSTWQEIEGSKLGMKDFILVPFQIVRLYFHYK